MARQHSSHIDDPVALGRRLRSTRIERGLTQSALVFDGCTIGHVSRIEAGLRTPSLQVVRRLAELLGVEEHWLATGTEAPPEPEEATLLRDARIALRLGQTAESEAALDRLGPEADLDPPLRARVLAGRGLLALHGDRAHDAVALLEAAFAIDPALDDADAAEALGRALARLERTRDAVAALERWLACAEEQGDPAGRLRFGVLLASVHRDADDPEAAARTLARIDEDVAGGDPLALARADWARSRAHARAGETRLAVDLARRTLEILETSESQVQRARAHRLLASSRRAAGSAAEALRLVRTARELLGPSLGARHDRMLLLVEEAHALVALGRDDDAAAAATEAAGILPADAGGVDLGRACAGLASAFEAAGDDGRARELLERAVDLLADGPHRDREDASRRLADLRERLGDADRAARLRAEA